MDHLIPLINVHNREECDIYLSSKQIQIGGIISNPLEHFSSYYFPPGDSTITSKELDTLPSFLPNLQRLITEDWFISLRSFAFQWDVTSGASTTLSILAKIFEHTSQLPNLRIFAWTIDCSSFSREENELPISKDLITSNSNLFPRVQSMKISFYAKQNTFVRIPISFFESYFSNTKSLSELQICAPFFCENINGIVSTLLASSKKSNQKIKTDRKYFETLASLVFERITLNEKIQLKTVGKSSFIKQHCLPETLQRYMRTCKSKRTLSATQRYFSH